MNDKRISLRGNAESVQDFPFFLQIINLSPPAIRHHNHQTIVRDATQYAFENLHVLVLYRENNSQFTLNTSNDVMINSLGLNAVLNRRWDSGARVKLQHPTHRMDSHCSEVFNLLAAFNTHFFAIDYIETSTLAPTL